MQLEVRTRITLIIVAGVVVLGLGVLAYLSGTPIDLSDLLGSLGGVATGLLAGFGIAGGPSPATTTASTTTTRSGTMGGQPGISAGVFPMLVAFGMAAIALLVILALGGCNIPEPQEPDDQAQVCRWEAAAVEATGAAVEALDHALASGPGEVPEEARLALATARETVVAGRAAVALCEDAVSRPRWWTWAGDALRALVAITDTLKTAGVPYAREIGIALAVVQSTLAAMAPPEPENEGAGDGKGSAAPSLAELQHATAVLRKRIQKPTVTP